MQNKEEYMKLREDDVYKMLRGHKHYKEWCESLNRFLPEFAIDTPKRIASFMAQCCVESANFTRLNENLNYSAEGLMRTWSSRFKTLSEAKQYARNPEKIANKVYAGRMGNGDYESGDGWKYRGRGIIQLTGKSNYEDFAEFIGCSLDESIEYILTYDGAVHAACYFWETRGLNRYADREDIRTITRLINGGTHGLENRISNYNKFIKILG